MYSLNMPVSQLRTKVRQEFERHRYVNKLPVVDMLLFRSHSEFQVWVIISSNQVKCTMQSESLMACGPYRTVLFSVRDVLMKILR